MKDQTEYCLIHRPKGTTEYYIPADYTIGWDLTKCRHEIERYREIVDTDDWEIGIRTVTPWSICQNWPKKVEEPTLHGIVTEPSKEGA